MTFFKTIKYCLTALLLLTFFSFSGTAYADGMGYSVKAIIPENQIDTTQTYFDLKMEPGQKQELELEIKSSSDQPLTLVVEPYVATTNQNGELEYSVDPEKYDSTLAYPITRLLSGKQVVTVKPKETKRVTFTLKMPKQSFTGKIVGGFNVYEQTEEEEVGSASKKNDVQIQNVYSVVVGIQVRESLDKVKPELKLNSVQADLFNYRTAITANIQNTKPEFISGLTIEAKVREVDSEEVLYEASKSDMSMAPNSNFDFPISLENKEITAGEYELELNAHSKDDQWSFKKKFTITDEEAAQFNEEAVELEEKTSNTMLIIIMILVGLVFAALIALIVVLWRRKK